MNDYFCVLPFYSYESTHQINENIYCCRLRPGANITQTRVDMQNKVRSSSCSTCWNLEDLGLTSERQIHNQTFDFYLDRDLEKIEQDAVIQGYQAKIVKLATSNLCNGTCVTCNSSLSSAWAALQNQPVDYRRQGWPQSIDYAGVTQLSFVGGEPLLEKINYEILQNLLDADNHRCFISIVTNGSCFPSQDQLEILQSFSNLNICFSIDGIGPVFEYMRFPLQWAEIHKNIQRFRAITSNISVSTMISNLNVFYYTDMIKYFDQHSLPYLCKQITHPSYFSPGNLPDVAKQQAMDSNPQYRQEIQKFLQCGVYSSSMFDQLNREVTRQDNLKKISIANYMPLVASTLKL